MAGTKYVSAEPQTMVGVMRDPIARGLSNTSAILALMRSEFGIVDPDAG